MYWAALVVAGLFEVVWAMTLKSTQGFTKLVPSVVTLGAMGLSFYFLSYALKAIPVGTGYAVWTGIGAVGTLILGMIFFGESRDLIRILCVLVIVACIIVLRVVK